MCRKDFNGFVEDAFGLLFVSILLEIQLSMVVEQMKRGVTRHNRFLVGIPRIIHGSNQWRDNG